MLARDGVILRCASLAYCSVVSPDTYFCRGNEGGLRRLGVVIVLGVLDNNLSLFEEGLYGLIAICF